MPGNVASTIRRMKATAAIAPQPSRDRTPARRDCWSRMQDSLSFLLDGSRVVENSNFVLEFAIIFFSLPHHMHYSIENNTSKRVCWIGAMRFLPLFLDTAAGVFILVGSGEPALGKLRLLRAAGAHVRWFPRDIDIAEEFLSLPARGRLEISVGDPLLADVSDVAAIVSAAGDPIDAQIAQVRRIPVNVVDRPELSTFIFPAIVDRGEVVVAIGTGGASPVLARRLRELIEALLPARIGDLAEL